ncbi:GNAT family N-acetyltransferase [Paraflavitalea sp. CAU 1676]|uniref:GNAT family N-acetyltransferase n=1 Tax=Paraflavitalea sp. CAU 1676 TaxID=3032598 RepID=UPI0023DAAF4F|nr:GNAT family N-acetyltransferase [Paraflavitalea sp. CAU 1676]MDF2188524.1 GNAT family N-acetyltransferase [Paraflavitalea sp. CAU 1676]
MGQISTCSHPDFLQILTDIEDFWGSNRTLCYHHPMFINEFGNTAFIIKDNDLVIAYLFGFVSQTAHTGYVHLIGVRSNYQKKGLGRILYGHFMEYLRSIGIQHLKAITTPTNQQSINFHLSLGMEMTGVENGNGIKVVKDYSGAGEHRVVFTMRFA